jgi:hypothetical protein
MNCYRGWKRNVARLMSMEVYLNSDLWKKVVRARLNRRGASEIYLCQDRTGRARVRLRRSVASHRGVTQPPGKGHEHYGIPQ